MQCSPQPHEPDTCTDACLKLQGMPAQVDLQQLQQAWQPWQEASGYPVLSLRPGPGGGLQLTQQPVQAWASSYSVAGSFAQTVWPLPFVSR